MATKLFQLRSGQFIIGDCETGDDGSVIVINPFEVIIETIPRRDGQGMEPRAAMFPYCLMSENRTFEFSKDQIQMSPREADRNCSENWRRATGGVVTASEVPKKSILLQG